MCLKARLQQVLCNLVCDNDKAEATWMPVHEGMAENSSKSLLCHAWWSRWREWVRAERVIIKDGESLHYAIKKEGIEKKFLSLSIHTIRYYGKIQIVKSDSFWGRDEKSLTVWSRESKGGISIFNLVLNGSVVLHIAWCHRFPLQVQ